MINSTKMYVKKKYRPMIQEIWKDSDGYWAASEDGWMFADMDCHTAHEDTQAELLQVFKSLKPCHCEECEAALKAKSKE